MQVVLAQAGIPDELLHPFKGRRPDGIIQPNCCIIIWVTVGSAPLAPGDRGQFGCRQSLQCFHTGVVIIIVCGEPADALCFKCLTGSDKALVVRGEGDVILLKKILVHHKSVCIRAHRKPVDAAILIHKTGEVCFVDSTCRIGGGKIHQAALQRVCIMQRKTAAGDDVRQSTVFHQEFVEIQVVISHHKFNVDVRELRLEVWRILIIQVCAP